MPPIESHAANDLFISYSHIDNRPWGAGQRCWVSELHKELATRLEMLLGREVRVWRDEKLNGNDELDDRVMSELRKSKAFVCVMSPRYLRSDWCVHELRAFLEQVRAAGSAGKKFVFKTVKTPVDRTQQPQEVQGLLGYEFFHETASGKVHEFYPSRAEESQESLAFWQKIDDLAQEIKTTFESSPHEIEPDGSERKTVYLAETTGDVKLARENIRRELAQLGYRIVPDRSLPWNADELLALIEADLRPACLTVHPVGARYGFVPEGDSRSIVELQIDAATTKNGHCQHVIWVSPEAAPAPEARQEQFIEKLRRIYTEQTGTELLEHQPLEELKTRLVSKLKSRKSAVASVPRGLVVYLICDRSDLPFVKPIEDHLRSQGFIVSLPLLEGDQQELREDHRDTLVCCDAVLVYYGSGREAWLRAKQRDLWQAPGWGRTKPLLGQAVLVAGANGPEQAHCVSDEFLVLTGETAAMAADLLSPFIEQIRTTLGARQ